MNLTKRRNNLIVISKRIASAMGLRDQRQTKLFSLAVIPGKHFGFSVKDQPEVPIVVQAAMRFSANMYFNVNPETLLWEQVPGYEHRIPYILTTLNRGLQEFDAFRVDNVFGLPVPRETLSEMRDNIERGYDTTVDNPRMLTGLLKLWLEELPHPLMQLRGTDEMLMSEVLQGTHATDEQILAVLGVNNERGITSVQRCVLEYVLNLLAVTVESLSEKSKHNNPETLARHLVYPLCHEPANSRAGNLAIPFLEQCIRYQVKRRQCDPCKFVPCGSITPDMRKFLINMLVRADNMDIYLGQVEDLERQMPNEKLIEIVEGHTKTPEHKGESRERNLNLDESLTGQYILEKTANPFHIPAGILKPFYKEWKVSEITCIHLSISVVLYGLPLWR